ncbi:hypothetical protein FVEG_06014 [Fusarium verticillioides 7600]|uniref:C2H2-type domain-containing protein n=1 Tax=Gibberella moniliformis (strain M3125 / FGSC 7600) TaxID=334819 RepID=W7MBT9_GIBM7|nr:hypothetical protein FVEG_06014 [Fusarium verticillioides 7600]EWG45080.1 hypothetical protein FVEG_06014 [Fusarium verticillioides 7600]
MDRRKLYRYIKNRDRRSIITNRELAWHGEKTYVINPTAAWNPWSKALECYLCHKLHTTLFGLKKHLESPRHQQSLYHCVKRSCGKEFKTLAALINHLESESCRIMRFQQQSNAIQQGQNHSSVPGYQRDFTCPFFPAQLNAASGVIHHLEQAACPNAPLNRDPHPQQVRHQDPPGSMSNRLIIWKETVTYQATALAFNARYGRYQCSLCGDTFRQLSSLNQHLASPRHQQDLYHCPNRGCHRVSTTLAGVINHLERGSRGFLRFDAF